MKLREKLRVYSRQNVYPMHMPGHKRNLRSDTSMYRLDITEIEGFDNLHQPKDLLKDAMAEAAALYGSEEAFYLVNGSTCGLLAAIFSMTKSGDSVLMARNCHKAVYHGMELRGVKVQYIMPHVNEEFGICGSIQPDAVEAILKNNDHIKLVVITSPTYEGVVSDIKVIAEIVHRYGALLLVDEAHGAHFGFSPAFPQSAVKLGADVVVQSLHKTLPSLTQTALLHRCSDRVSSRDLLRYLNMFETSSPSYVLMAAIDRCIDLLNEYGKGLFSAYEKRLDQFDFAMNGLEHLKVFAKGKNKADDFNDIFAVDIGKIVVSTKKTNITGVELSDILRQKYLIEVEMAAADYLIAMTTICDNEAGFLRLTSALLEIDKGLSFNDAEQQGSFEEMPVTVMSASDADNCNEEIVPLNGAVGRIAKEYVYAYPPGIPLVIPGEQISAVVVDEIKSLCSKGVNIQSSGGEMPHKIAVVL